MPTMQTSVSLIASRPSCAWPTASGQRSSATATTTPSPTATPVRPGMPCFLSSMCKTAPSSGRSIPPSAPWATPAVTAVRTGLPHRHRWTSTAIASSITSTPAISSATCGSSTCATPAPRTGASPTAAARSMWPRMPAATCSRLRPARRCRCTPFSKRAAISSPTAAICSTSAPASTWSSVITSPPMHRRRLSTASGIRTRRRCRPL